MIQSMTGFAERTFSSPVMRVKVSLKSLNHRFLDWSYKGAPLGVLENRVKTACQRKIRRGRIEASLEITRLDPAGWDIFINEPLLARLIRALEKASAGARAEVRFAVDNVFRIPYLAEMRPKGLRRSEAAFLVRCFERTLEDLVRARRREGRGIVRQLRGHARAISRVCLRMESRFHSLNRLLPLKIRRKFRELGGRDVLSEERMAQEAALQAQRQDITEEIARLKSHLQALDACLAPGRGEPRGRMLDFLSQELLREVNTINSKSQDLSLIRDSLAVKGEVESIRQQVQNLE
ncbi:MAG: YicC family protein [Candidatus Aminicenantes bacterium]|nr:YicC family protein [Candidatus Aminicenantes bacterium]